MDNITLVGVGGLPAEDAGPRLWDPYWLERMRTGLSNPHISFDAKLDPGALAPDVLSHAWLERTAEELLKQVKEEHKEGNRLVFFGENLGGIVLKRALVLADSDAAYDGIARDACACVFNDVMHTASSHEAWTQALVRQVATSWRLLPKDLWISITTLPEALDQLSFDFARVAPRLMVITVFRPDVEVTTKVLRLSHERLVPRPSSQGAGRPSSESDTASSVFDLVRRAVAVTSETRHHLRDLSSLGWGAQAVPPRGLGGDAETLTKEVELVTNLLNREANIVALHGPRGIGKLSFLSHAYYHQLLFHRKPIESCAFFAFDGWGHKSQPVSAVLRSIIIQLLSWEPEIVSLVQAPMLDPTKDAIARQTEGNLWIQLRRIIQNTKCERITIAMNSIDNWSKQDDPGFTKALFDLQVIASGRLKILCTMDTHSVLSVANTASRMLFVNLEDLPGLKAAKVAFQGRLANDLVSEMPKFAAIGEELTACLAKSGSFLHASLVAHRIRSAQSLSSPVHVREDLQMLGGNFDETVLGIVATCPPWVGIALDWMLFAQRPLRTEELAVAVALRDWPISWTATSLVAADYIPRDMAGDLKRQLGPLVVARNGRVRFVHVSVDTALRKAKGKEATGNILLILELVRYLRSCLDRVPVGESWRDLEGPRFGLLKYALHHWHVHYSRAMGRIVPPLAPSSALLQVHDIAVTLFTNPEYRCQLQPNLQAQDTRRQDAEDPGSTETERPVLLAARLGLLDIVVRLMDKVDSPTAAGDTHGPRKPEENGTSGGSGENGNSDVVDVFHIACQSGFQLMAEYFLSRIVDKTVLAEELALACLRGNETIFRTLLRHYRLTLRCKDLPPQLLFNACLAGHASLAETLLSEGADPNGPVDGAPLHQAVDHGHLDVVDLLLHHQADVMALFPDQSTPLHHSIQHGYSDISIRLLEEPEIQDIPDEHGVTALHLAAEKGDVRIIRCILNLTTHNVPRRQHQDGTESTKGGSPIIESDSPLHRAAANGHLEAVKVLLEESDNFSVNELDTKGQSALYLALSADHRDVADFLLSDLPDRRDKVKITVGKTYAESELKQAIRHGNVSAVNKLLRLGANPDGSNDGHSSPLADAIKGDHTEIVRALLEGSASMTQTVDFGEDEAILGETIGDGWLPQHFAAYYGSIDVMGALSAVLPSGLAVARTRSGHTPLHLAVFRRHESIVERMLSKQPQVMAGVGDSDRSDDDPGRWVLERRDSWKRRVVVGSTVLPFALAMGTSALFGVNSQTDEGITALHIAAANGHVHLAKLLMASGALLEVASKSGRRAIHYAADAKKDADSMVRLLLQSGCEVQPRDLNGTTPLHLAASSSDEAHEIAVLLLLRKGADPNEISQDGLSALYLAASSGSVAVVRYLVQYGADVNATVNKEGSTALHAAVSSGETELITILADAGADLDVADDTGDTPLHGAVRSENMDAATILLQRGASINATNTRRITALHRSVLNTSTQMAKLLLDSGADPNIPDEDGDTTLTAATMAGEPDMVTLLLDSKYDTKVNVINSSGQTPLMLALRSPGRLLPPLLLAQPKVELCGYDGVTVLHMAAGRGFWEVSKILPLFQYGRSHLDAKDREGLAPIHHAARHGHKATIKALHAAGANMTARDKQGRTAMHFAVRTMWASSIEGLFEEFLRPEVDNKINIPDVDGWTPLHWACMTDDAPLIRWLLDQCKTDQERRDLILQEQKYGWTAWAIADFCGAENNREALLAALERLRAAGVEGIPAQPPAVKRPTQHSGFSCDDCRIGPISGLRFNCNSHYNFDFCFKCYWHREKTHFPSGHTFSTHGEGPTKGPPYQSLTEQEPESVVSTESIASNEPEPSMQPPPTPSIMIPQSSGGDGEFPQWLRATSSTKRRRERRRPSTLVPVTPGLDTSERDKDESQTLR